MRQPITNTVHSASSLYTPLVWWLGLIGLVRSLLSMLDTTTIIKMSDKDQH